jgi:hypothetical protein
MQSLSLSFCVCACALSDSNIWNVKKQHLHMTHMTDFGHLYLTIMSEINVRLLCKHACIIIIYRLTYIIIHTCKHTYNQINSFARSPWDTLWLRNLLPIPLYLTRSFISQENSRLSCRTTLQRGGLLVVGVCCLAQHTRISSICHSYAWILLL